MGISIFTTYHCTTQCRSPQPGSTQIPRRSVCVLLGCDACSHITLNISHICIAWQSPHSCKGIPILSLYLYCVSKKYPTWCLLVTLTNVDRFSKFFLPIDLQGNSLCIHCTAFHLTCSTLLHYQIQKVTDFDSIFNKLLTRSPEDTLNTWFNI